MTNKALQRRRMITYFVEAARSIIEKEGIEGITIRKVAKIAGYNSATLYNYFENIDHLIYLTSLTYLKDYIQNIQVTAQTHKSAMDQYIFVWESFARYAFNSPQYFYIVFYSKISNQYQEYYSLYDEVFNAGIREDQEPVSVMLREKNIYRRSEILMKQCIDEGIFSNHEGMIIDEIVILTFGGILEKVMSEQLSKEEAMKKFSNYLEYLLHKKN